MSINRYWKGFTTLVLSIMLLTAAGCATQGSNTADAKVDLEAVVSQEARKLISQMDRHAPGRPFIAASFADIDNLGQSSTFGRVLGEQFSSALTRAGLPVIEVKMRGSLFIKEGTGELMLSRQLHSLMQAHDAQAVLVGTYAVGGSNIYVTARLVRTDDNMILAAEDFTLPINRDIRSLLPHRR